MVTFLGESFHANSPITRAQPMKQTLPDTF